MSGQHGPDVAGTPPTRPDEVDVEEVLLDGELVVLGRVADSSNVTLLAEVDGHRAAYKPIAGERPLWDFPDGTLALREHATWLVSRALGWDVVPTTVLRDGPHGAGSVQLWVEGPGHAGFVAVVPSGTAEAGWLAVLSGEDQDGEPVDVVHRDTPALRRLALLDLVVNNSDRKGGHVLESRDGQPRGIDHGLTFHTDPKVRTVLWGWIDRPFTDEERAALERLVDALRGDLGARLRELLADDEVDATLHRTLQLLTSGRFPAPDGGWPAVPWPPF